MPGLSFESAVSLRPVAEKQSTGQAVFQLWQGYQVFINSGVNFATDGKPSWQMHKIVA